MNLGRLLSFSVSVSSLINGSNKSIYFKELLYGLNEIKDVKYLAQSMVSAQINGHYDDVLI